MGERFHDGDEARLPFVFVQAINLELSQYPTAGAAAADFRIRWHTDACLKPGQGARFRRLTAS